MRQQNLLGLTLFSAVQVVIKTTVEWRLGGRRRALGQESQGHCLGPHRGADSLRQVGFSEPVSSPAKRQHMSVSFKVAVGFTGDEAGRWRDHGGVLCDGLSSHLLVSGNGT